MTGEWRCSCRAAAAGQSGGGGGGRHAGGSGTMEACVWVFQMFFSLHTYTSFMFSCLNNKQTKIQFSIFTSGTIPLPFYLSKYIIYIILEYIKYRMGTIPSHTSRVLCKYSNNCSKTQSVCNGKSVSTFTYLLVCHLKTWWIILKIRFWLLGEFDRFSPVQWMTLKRKRAFCSFKMYLPEPTRAECYIKCFSLWKLKIMLSDPHFA